METISIFDATADKRSVDQEQKAWKYIRNLCGFSGSELNRTAIIDGSKKYTFGRMFREWERYASVFTALDMTEEKHSRVGVLGSTCAEVTFAFYGLNMVGAQVSLVASWSAFNFTRIEETIRQEKLTDFIITDDLAQPDLVRELMLKRKELGLNHLILLHVSIGGATSVPMLAAVQEAKYASMKALFRPICMETLLASYGSRPVRYALKETDENALIMHTTGTTSGTGKPVPMSDCALNAAVASFMMIKDISLPFDHLVSATMLDLSNSYGIIDQVHLPFAMGATVVTVPLGFLNPWFYKAISAHRISFLFSASYMLERWMKLPEDTGFDFSSLKFVAL
ncbi:MAG: AMP-binding protein, partial [Lachnospiraceae bacterium]|nr:AMP-binding protein [Lachnospiraceae bacterium]